MAILRKHHCACGDAERVLFRQINGSRPGGIHRQRAEGDAEQLFIESEDPLGLFAERPIELPKQLTVELPAKARGGILPRTDRRLELRDAGRQMRLGRQCVQVESLAVNCPKERLPFAQMETEQRGVRRQVFLRSIQQSIARQVSV